MGNTPEGRRKAIATIRKRYGANALSAWGRDGASKVVNPRRITSVEAKAMQQKSLMARRRKKSVDSIIKPE